MNSKTVLITGAARRIGAAIAQYLHRHGMNIVVHYNSSDNEASKLVEQLNHDRADSAIAVGANLMDRDGYVELVNTATAFRGRLDVLVNNASQFYPTPMGTTSFSEWDELTGTNMMAPYFLAQACMQPLKAVHGCIINITDIYGEQPLRSHPVYSAAKAGLIMLTQAMAMELAPEVRVNAVSPGAILWPEDQSAAQKEKILADTMLQQSGSPDDIARAVKFLIEDAAYITGQVLRVDGGRFD